MEALPNEIILSIAKNLTATECRALADSSKRYAWLFNDKSLWKHLASRDLKYPDIFFEDQLDALTPEELYRDVARCYHLNSRGNSLVVKRCHRPVFPGTPYCRDHCAKHSIRICTRCQQTLVNVVDFSRTAFLATHDTCQTCQADKPDELVVAPVLDRSGHYRIIRGPLAGVVIRRLDDVIVAIGRELTNSSDLYHSRDGLRPLTQAETELAHKMGLSTRSDINPSAPNGELRIEEID